MKRLLKLRGVPLLILIVIVVVCLIAMSKLIGAGLSGLVICIPAGIGGLWILTMWIAAWWDSKHHGSDIDKEWAELNGYRN